MSGVSPVPLPAHSTEYTLRKQGPLGFGALIPTFRNMPLHPIFLLPERTKRNPTVQKVESETETSSFLCTHEQMGQRISEDRNSLGREGV